jgi:hypothetical protein
LLPDVKRSGVLAIVCLVAACGSSGASPSGVPADFATRALAVCQQAYDLKQSIGPFPFPSFNPINPDASQLPAVGAFLQQKTAVKYATWLAGMQALGEPQTGQAAWADLLAAIERHLNLNADQIAAAGRGDGATFARDYAAGAQAQADLLRAATAAGVPDCAKVDR